MHLKRIYVGQMIIWHPGSQNRRQSSGCYSFIFRNINSSKWKKKERKTRWWEDSHSEIRNYSKPIFLNGAGETEPLPTYIFVISPKNQYINSSSGAICRLLSLPIRKLTTLAHRIQSKQLKTIKTLERETIRFNIWFIAGNDWPDGWITILNEFNKFYHQQLAHWMKWGNR